MNKQLRKAEAELAARLQLQPKRFWNIPRLMFAALVLALAIAAALYPWRSHNGGAYVTSATATGSLTVTVSATGTLQPQDEVDVGAEISGRVDQVNVDYNDHVKKGQVLAVINTDQIKAQLAQAVAAQNAARAVRCFRSAASRNRRFRPRRPITTARWQMSRKQKRLSRMRARRRRCTAPNSNAP